MAVPADVELYGIHAVEVANLFLGRDIVAVRGMSAPGRQVVLLEYRDGRSAVLEHVTFLRYPVYVVVIYSNTWYHQISLEPPNTLLALARQIVDFFRGGPIPVTPNEAIDLIHITETAKETLRSNIATRFGDAW
ncbi:hypothetical protein [Haloechinothrix salitolerans]|uniref:Uncharacterized protein n=1 Tax=Haloechinothrix salitolerans TaxID=926830 RepID=A0ABW2C1L9_9PSEU